MNIPIYKPYFTERSLRYAHDALDSTWISSQGKYLEMTKERLQDFLGVKYILLTNTGTAANHLMAKGLKLKDSTIKNILVPNNVYIAAWNGFLFDRGDFTLINTDTDLETWNYDRSSYDVKRHEVLAILIVNNLGNIINVPKLQREQPNALFVEDNCEGFGGMYEGKFSGTMSLCSTLSFYGNKNITSGEGGALVTNDSDLYEYARLVWGQGQSNEKFVHSILGYNYRMTNVEAAILYGQLDLYSEILDRKTNIFNWYKKELSGIQNIKFQKEEENTIHSKWMFGIRIVGNKDYKSIERFFIDNGIETRPFFYHIQKHKYLNSIWNNMTNAKLLANEIFILPSYPSLSEKEIKYISNKVKEYARTI